MILLEWCHSYEERAAFIRTDKAKDEQELRLRLLKEVRGTIPDEVVKAGRAFDKARRAYDKAARAYYGARQVYDKARRAYAKARQAYFKAIRNNLPAIEALHKEECTDCSWDGHTIFPAQSE